MQATKRIVFFGTPEFAAAGLTALVEEDDIEVGLVITQPDKPAGRGGALKHSAVKEIAIRFNIPVFQPNSLRKESEKTREHLEKHGPFDIGVVIAYGQILPPAILDAPRRGCINVHASLLPRWRGAAPIQRAILAGDKETGVCLMQMDEGLDTGAVYSEERVEISAEDNFKSMHDKLAIIGTELLKRDILKIINGELKSVPQPETGATYAEKIKAEEARIDWSRSADEVSRLVRALSPVPGAFTLFNKKRLKIFSSLAYDSEENNQPAGSVKFADKNTLEVHCGRGVLSLLDVQLEGKRRMPIAEFLKGVQISARDTFNQ